MTTTLLLIDGSSYLYRAFHALPNLRNADGEPTGAIYGVIGMLRRLEADYKADYYAVVFDAKGKTFRNDWYPEYKANRPPMPEDLQAQIEPIHMVIKALGWPIISIPGVEADDVIGVLSRQAQNENIKVIISTGDKDMAQLVQEGVTLVNTMSNEVLDRQGVEAKFGVWPEQIIDYLTLVGDATDNVPGVDKVGPKTAAKWLNEYTSLANIIENADKIKGVVGENLRRHLDFLPLAKRLVTICTELPEYNIPATKTLQRNAVDSESLQSLFTHFGFRSWLKELAEGRLTNAGHDKNDFPALKAEGPEFTAKLHENHRDDYELIINENLLNQWLAKLMTAHEQNQIVALDTETTSLDPMIARLVGISFAIHEGEAAYLPLRHDYPGVPEQISLGHALDILKPWLESEQHKKVGQNIKYDQHVFANHDIKLRGIGDDTLLAAYVLEAGRYIAGSFDMDKLASRHLSIKTISYTDLCGKGVNQISFNQVALGEATDYAAEDADITLRLRNRFNTFFMQKNFENLHKVYREIELPVEQILLAMERTGVLIDTKLLAEQSHQLGKRLLEIEAEAYQLAGHPFNLGSPKQLAEVLFNEQKIPVNKKTPGGAPSTSEEVLSELALDYPLAKVILEARSLAKLKSTYTDKLPKMVNAKTGRVHTNFSQAVAVTGRLASSDPNLQNIPVRTAEGRRIRNAFIAKPGAKIISADYSQIELRIMAHLSADNGLTQAFQRGEDVHRATAAEIFSCSLLEVGADERRVAKVINFGLIYGMSVFGLVRELGLSRHSAQNYIDRYFARYPGVADYMNMTREKARQQGFVETVFGRRLWLPEIRAQQATRRQAAERAAINAPMQGTAADLIKLAMIAVYRWIKQEKLSTRMLLQVHDELVFEVPENELGLVRMQLPRLMTSVAKLNVPLAVDISVGANWGEAH